MTPTLRYLYAFAPASAADAIRRAGLRGIEDGPVGSVVGGALLGATSFVDAAAYDEAPLNEHIQDLEWLAPRAAAHQEVNAKLLALTDTIVPLAFGSIHTSDDRIRELLRERQDELVARLDALRGRAEWIVSVERRDDTDVESPALKTLEREIAASPPGRAFLLGKRREAVAREERRVRDAAAAEEVAAAVGSASDRVYREPLIDDSAVSSIARFSVLVAREREGDLRERLDATRSGPTVRGYTIRLSGPWPAYRFGGMPLEPAPIA
jgi:hypothetical protein